jgi:hypothetical protein
MRIWIPISINEFEQFTLTKTLSAPTGFAVTKAWSETQEDQDEEVLEALVLELAAQNAPVVLVIEAAATEVPGTAGEVKLGEAISERQIRAIFAATPQEPDELLWFGPTEVIEVKAFIGLD